MSVHFLGGLPRASSTALTAILAQNPDFGVTATSPMAELVMGVRKIRSTSNDFRALHKNEVDARMLCVQRHIIEGWFEAQGKRINFDKGRAWVSLYPLLSHLYNNPKIIVPIRDLRGCVASMEKLHRANPGMEASSRHITLQARVEGYLTDSPLARAIDSLMEAYQLMHTSKMLIVKAEDLGNAPEVELKRIYEFIGETWYEGHSYTTLKAPASENDHVHAPFGEHAVQSTVIAPPQDWDAVLGADISNDIVTRYPWFYREFYGN